MKIEKDKEWWAARFEKDGDGAVEAGTMCETMEEYNARVFDLSNPDNRYPWEDEDGEAPFSPPDDCKGCGGAILPENRTFADGCPCNSPRGVNHGRVPKNTCTCLECDPEQTGSTRYPVSRE